MIRSDVDISQFPLELRSHKIASGLLHVTDIVVELVRGRLKIGIRQVGRRLILCCHHFEAATDCPTRGLEMSAPSAKSPPRQPLSFGGPRRLATYSCLVRVCRHHYVLSRFTSASVAKFILRNCMYIKSECSHHKHSFGICSGNMKLFPIKTGQFRKQYRHLPDKYIYQLFICFR